MISEIRVTRYPRTTQRVDFGVVYHLDGERRYFRLGFTDTFLAVVGTTLTLDDFAKRVAEALVANSTAEQLHPGYLIESDDFHSPESVLAAIHEGVARFVWQGSIPD